jgi:large subunit ribosomal protein L23
MNQYDIIIKPLNTEKTNIQHDELNKVSFEVARDANRIDIKTAIEQIFKVSVDNVSTIQVKGKRKQKGKISGKRRDWKKAIVTLMPGEKIDFFEGV